MNMPGFSAESALGSRAGRPWAGGLARGSEADIVPASHARVDCSEHCAGNPDPQFCECLCRNRNCRTTGRCIPTPCWPSF